MLLLSGMNQLKVGFIGCGGIASAHAERLAKFENVKLVSFSDVVVENAKNFARKYNGNAYSDWEDMLDKEKLDIVFVCLPPFSHKDEVIVAAEKGINIYIEKPIALDTKLAKNMVRAVEKSGVKSQVGYQLRFSAGVEKAKDLIEKGIVGEIGLVNGKYWCRFIRKDWWIDKSKSGGQIVEQSTHLYDIIRWLVGDASKVHAEMSRTFYKDMPGMTIEDVSAVLLKFKSGAVGAITATIGAVENFWWLKWEIVGSNNLLESEEPNSLKVYYSTQKPPNVEEFKDADRDPMTLSEKDLIDAVIEDRETRTPISEGAKTLELTLAAVKAADEGKDISLE